ncbi:hypothetical protein EGW08_022173, partial [Elysia chlorotica]
MSELKKTVCVIGAGESGLAALKECVLQGMEPTCYDLDSDIGGMWHAKPATDASRNTPAIWPSLISNNSKHNMCFSDFPPDDKDPVFLSPKQLCAYFKRAVNHFGLEKYIHLRTRVVRIRETPDHEKTGRWEVYTCPSHVRVDGQEELANCRKQIFDNVIICAGWYKKPQYPDSLGLEKFQGVISHSFNYSGPRSFDGKKVLVVGNRFSAAEITSDVANYASETYMALGKGTWILPRLFKGGSTFDLSIPRKMVWSGNHELQFNEFVVEEANRKLDHEKTGIRRASMPYGSAFCFSDELPVKIASGKIKAYGNLSTLGENSATFDDGETVTGLDAVIFCTGYSTELSFIDTKIHDSDGRMELFMMVFPLHRAHSTLAVIGHYATDGPMVVMGENQARLAVSVMSGRHALPSQEEMAHSVQFWNDASSSRTTGFHRYYLPGFAFMDAIAEEGGFYPSFWKIFIRDPVLAWRTWHGPYLAAQYRLVGPGSQWDSARRICLRAHQEGFSCVRHKNRKESQHLGSRDKLKRKSIFKSTNSVVGLCVVLSGLVCLGLFGKSW